jgi:signal transduction histidine kinase
MRSLYLRIWLTVVAALALFALVSGWLLQRHLDDERERAAAAAQDRLAAWGEMLERSLPPPAASAAEQGAALQEWAQRLRVPLALDDATGRRIAASEGFQRRESDGGPMMMMMRRPTAIPLDDGRTLWIMRPTRMHGPAGRHGERPAPLPPPWWTLPGLPGGTGLALLLVVLFAAVAAGAWPVVRRLTRRLETLKRGVEAFGAGALSQRVPEDGRDEVAALASSFNRAAERIEALLRSHQSLLANASHELRSPLARLKMALALLDETPAGAPRAALQQEIHANIGELDALVEEVLLASRLDASTALDRRDPVELLPLAVEEASRIGATASGDAVTVPGDERLLRRALRNLLENARRYGGGEVAVTLAADAGGEVRLAVCDRGPGVPEAERERIFEPFYRLPGHAERAGGVGLGLSLVRQIAERHGGRARCETRAGGGSCFVLTLPR